MRTPVLVSAGKITKGTCRMNRNWTTSGDGGMGEPLTTRQKVVVFILGFALFLVAVGAAAYTSGQYDRDREVWWTQPCPTQTQPHRVCLDGRVSLDRIPTWAGGTAQE